MVARQTVTLANSIVGVSVLAMPFCFKQCGILLATLLLMIGAIMTRMVCYFLLKAGTITRRRNYEMLAWQTFGQGGKFVVEITIIGFLIGTLIAFFVVMGDLGPEIASEVLNIQNNDQLRTIIMAGLGIFVALPLGLLRNIDSLSSVSTISMFFYVFLVFKILSEGVTPLLSGSYLDRIDYWKPSGVLQCAPIFSMALACQTQIFGIYESLPEPSLSKMNDIVKQAINMCTAFYFCVGFFGYVAFSHQGFGGNILLSFSPSGTTQLMKLCFLMTIVFSVPLVVFPCRASLHSLIFRRVHMHHSLHDASTNYIPDGRLKLLTVLIIAFSLVVGLIIPNIELVLGLVGSTAGTVICIIFPSIMFIRVTSKQTTERLIAQVIFVIGVVTMVVSTYTTLYAVEQSSKSQAPQPPAFDPIKQASQSEKVTPFKSPDNKISSKASFQTPDGKILDKNPALKTKLAELKNLKKEPDKEKKGGTDEKKLHREKEDNNGDSEKEKESPMKIIPVPVEENKEEIRVIEKKVPENVKEDKLNIAKPEQPVKEQNFKSQESPKAPLNIPASVVVSNQSTIKEKAPVSVNKTMDHVVEKNIEVRSPQDPLQSVSGIPPVAPVAEDGKDKPAVEKEAAVEILKKLEEHQESQKKILEEQKKILEELREHHDQDVHRRHDDSEELPPQMPPEANRIQEIEVAGGEQFNDFNNPQRKEEPSQRDIDKKVDDLHEERLIEKFSENIEKEKETAKLLEKIEEGLNKEIVNNNEGNKAEAVVSQPKAPLQQSVVENDESKKVGKIETDLHQSLQEQKEHLVPPQPPRPQTNNTFVVSKNMKPLPLQNLERLQQQQQSLNKLPEVVPFVNGSHSSGGSIGVVLPVIPQEMSSSSKRSILDVDVKQAEKKENHDHDKNAEKSEDVNKNNDNQQAEAAKKAVDREI